jgi:glycosyltransferase involved in cell wall biosynthesis
MSDLRIVYLAAGAAGMYCGSCIRDNRVAATLRAMGRDIKLIPLYTPLRTDEHDVSERRVLYGGINVYLEQKFALFRHLPAWLGRVLDAPTLLRGLSRWSAAVAPDSLGALTVSVLKGEHGAQRIELKKLLEVLAALRPDIVHLPNLPFIGVAHEIKTALGATVFCTLSGEDIFLDELPEPHRTRAFGLIREQAGGIDAYVATSDYYADHAAAHFGLPRDRVHTVRMGLHVDDFAEPLDPPDRPFTIGCLARICPEKGLAILCEAFVILRRAGRDCRLRIAGYLARTQQPFLDELRDDLRQPATRDAVDFVGEVTREQKIAFLRSLNVLSVPTVYPEAKGLYVLEAMACGVPVVQPRHGSFPELIETTDGGVLYDPGGGVNALAIALAELMDDPAKRRDLSLRGWKSVHALFTDKIMAEQTWALYERYRNEYRSIR